MQPSDVSNGAQYRGNQIKEQLTGYMHEAMHGAQGVSNYLRNNDAAAMRADLEAQVRAHPLTAIAIGLGVGYLIGKLLK